MHFDGIGLPMNLVYLLSLKFVRLLTKRCKATPFTFHVHEDLSDLGNRLSMIQITSFIKLLANTLGSGRTYVLTLISRTQSLRYLEHAATSLIILLLMIQYTMISSYTTTRRLKYTTSSITTIFLTAIIICHSCIIINNINTAHA